MMKKNLFVVVFFCFLGVARAGDWGEVRCVEGWTNVRAARDARSRILKVLDPGKRVKVDFLENRWYAVFPLDEPVRNESKRWGYVYAPLLKPVLENEVASAPEAVSGKNRTGSKVKSGASAVVQARKTTYEIVDTKTVQSAFGERLEVKIMLKTRTMPEEKRIKIIAARVQRESKGTWRQASIEFYLPGLNLHDPAYAVVRFDESGLREFWTRDTVLYGTKWSKYIK